MTVSPNVPPRAVDNVVQANILAAVAPSANTGNIYNVACGDRITLNASYKVAPAQKITSP